MLGLSAAVAPATADAATPHWGTYVALGDSYAAGPGLPEMEFAPCERSRHNYAHNLAEALHVDRLIDATCGGAVTDDFSRSQKPGAPPQFEAITPDTELVTVTIGGNDAGFSEVLGTCGALSLAPIVADPCHAYYTQTGTDALTDRLETDVAPKVRAVFDGIRARAPHATIVATGYPRLTPTAGSCFPALPFAPGDYAWINQVQDRLNAAIAEQARAAGIEYADLLDASAGHDACRDAQVRWVEPTLNSSSAPAHPNHAGMSAIAQVVANRIAQGFGQ
ncbi:SGNH/GDSL hydrolase family protein [Nocardia cerradoensis]|nr:SGNH/GDSL hydrolase family protein [Nocardia cerradoensis]